MYPLYWTISKEGTYQVITSSPFYTLKVDKSTSISMITEVDKVYYFLTTDKYQKSL